MIEEWKFTTDSREIKDIDREFDGNSLPFD